MLLSLAACSDPGGVGANVGREPLSGENPSETTVMAVPTSDTTEASLTGLDGQGQSWRFLVGNVSDNLDGRLTNNLEIEADGYVDIGGPSASNPFSNTSASELSASLRLVPTYRHGDTTATLDMELCDLQSSGVDMGRTRADESFATSNRIQSYSISPADLSAPLDQDTVTLDLPQSWIDNNASALKSDDDNLNGFKLAPTGSNTVIVGFQHGSATLRVTTNSDTADFGVQQSFTHIGETSGSTPTVSSPNQRLLLDGVGRGLAFNWTKSDKFAALTDSVVVSRAQIRASFDTGIYESNNTPSDFVRPSASDYRILATRRSGGPSCSTLDLSKLNDDTCVFPMEASEDPGDAQSDRGSTIDTFDRWLSGERPLDAFRLGIADRDQIPSGLDGTTRRGLPSTIPAVVKLDSVNVALTEL
ncbi:MAG: hypothetical protein BRD55_07465 [Bacteroidetes bacterium SW_9_63_38]|nr:MAG: hypothetical protein BRD55_07465 [Bacteroidetes bacterium SW_9_63_38]